MPDQMELTRFSPTDAAIALLAKEYLPLTISGLDDLAGYKAVHQARMIVKGQRVGVEKTRKELKASALVFGRKVDTEAKRLTALLEPIEEHLLVQEKTVDAERERIANAARLAAEAELRAKAKAAEAEHLAAQEAREAEIFAEREKLDAERQAMREKYDRVVAEQKAAQDKIDADRRVVEAEKMRLADIETKWLRAEEMKKAKAEAAETARIETEDRLAREAGEKLVGEKAKAEAETTAREKAEALRPDCEKLLSVAVAVQAISIPTVSADAEKAWNDVLTVLKEAEQLIRDIVKDMV